MAEKRDYYDVLGVSRTASDEEIRSIPPACTEYHPDSNPETNRRRQSSRNPMKLTAFCLTRRRSRSMTRSEWQDLTKVLPARSAVLVGMAAMDTRSFILMQNDPRMKGDVRRYLR